MSRLQEPEGAQVDAQAHQVGVRTRDCRAQSPRRLLPFAALLWVKGLGARSAASGRRRRCRPTVWGARDSRAQSPRRLLPFAALPSEKGTTSEGLQTFALHMAQVKAIIWPWRESSAQSPRRFLPFAALRFPHPTPSALSTLAHKKQRSAQHPTPSADSTQQHPTPLALSTQLPNFQYITLLA